MKNKKGFTLVEMLAVVTILALATSSSIINIQKISKESKEKRYNDVINEIVMATDVYINNNDALRKSILNNNTKVCTRIYTLQNEGYINSDIINPLTNKLLQANMCVYSMVDEEGNIIHEINL